MAVKRKATKVARPGGLPNRRGWHLDKTVSIANIAVVLTASITLGGSMLAFARAMETRVVTLETVNVETAKADGKRDADTREQRQLSNTRMDRVESSLLAIQLQLAALVGTPGTPPPTIRKMPP